MPVAPHVRKPTLRPLAILYIRCRRIEHRATLQIWVNSFSR
jgi:hypothetical protein